jgi:hypothetical protein
MVYRISCRPFAVRFAFPHVPSRAFMSVRRPLSRIGEADKPHTCPASAVRVDELDASSLHYATDGGDSAEVRPG